MLNSYKDLIVYQKGYSLSLKIYKVTIDYPHDERFGLISQMRRSAVSIPCNIAEGYSRKNIKEYLQFLYIAYGSCSELETLLSLSKDLGLLNSDKYTKLYGLQEEVSKLLNGLIKSLSKQKKGESDDTAF
ncbi:MAG TPA: four helix bundle protein [Syntrophaceae bacterium]|nr:four helix bundle protein [Syntrophaceae bacterium]